VAQFQFQVHLARFSTILKFTAAVVIQFELLAVVVFLVTAHHMAIWMVFLTTLHLKAFRKGTSAEMSQTEIFGQKYVTAALAVSCTRGCKHDHFLRLQVRFPGDDECCSVSGMVNIAFYRVSSGEEIASTCCISVKPLFLCKPPTV
jgi:hypothetical protein